MLPNLTIESDWCVKQDVSKQNMKIQNTKADIIIIELRMLNLKNN